MSSQPEQGASSRYQLDDFVVAGLSDFVACVHDFEAAISYDSVYSVNEQETVTSSHDAFDVIDANREALDRLTTLHDQFVRAASFFKSCPKEIFEELDYTFLMQRPGLPNSPKVHQERKIADMFLYLAREAYMSMKDQCEEVCEQREQCVGLDFFEVRRSFEKIKSELAEFRNSIHSVDRLVDGADPATQFVFDHLGRGEYVDGVVIDETDVTTIHFLCAFYEESLRTDDFAAELCIQDKSKAWLYLERIDEARFHFPQLFKELMNKSAQCAPSRDVVASVLYGSPMEQAIAQLQAFVQSTNPLYESVVFSNNDGISAAYAPQRPLGRGANFPNSYFAPDGYDCPSHESDREDSLRMTRDNVTPEVLSSTDEDYLYNAPVFEPNPNAALVISLN